ncbi:MAG TPA: hypothetical protein VH641_07480 [Streptosporangiaceae bacterium]
MHDIGRTQLEQQTFGEFETGEYASGEYEGGEYEGGEYEGGEFSEYEGGEYEGGEYEGGEYEGGEYEGESEMAHAESPLGEMQEMELASELLEVSSEQELEQFLSDVIRTATRGARSFLRSNTGKALGGILKDSLRGAAKEGLPSIGRAIGERLGYRDYGGRAGKALAAVLGLELEGLSAEDREFEVARQLVRFVGSAAGQAVAAPPQLPPAAAAETAARRAAQIYAPGLVPRLQGRSTHMWPRGGRWVRRGRTIVLYGF